jgi:thymidylate synthase (FAD)
MIKAKLIAATQPVGDVPANSAEELVAFCARVSSGREYEDRGKDYKGLLNYCMRNKHWSIFQMVNAVVEVRGPRDITRQFTRHESLYVMDDEVVTVPGFDKRFGGLQEFSQRYSDDIEFCSREIREQDPKNRQNSINSDSLNHNMWNEDVDDLTRDVEHSYKWWLNQGVAKECARVLLPEGLTMSSLYVNGTFRSWLHYLDVRDDPGVTQHEHVLLAREIKKALEPIMPTILGLETKDD